ncbi:MAG: FAD-dependent oxidoreductase [Rhodothermales bacterium]
MQHTSDILIIGAGFGGSMLAMGLAKQGWSVVVVDRAQHPRFAIGESSTPIADMILRDLAARYDWDWLQPLTRYGSWKATYPDLTCGLKRGFSYFAHTPGQPFQPNLQHSNELLVAASSSDTASDTQWLRADVDAFLAGRARDAGIRLHEGTTISALHRTDDGWLAKGVDAERVPLSWRPRFVLDASGAGGVVPRLLGVAPSDEPFETHSYAVYSHFENVAPWPDLYAQAGGELATHPFTCDAAALHHLLEEGWMWQLRFNDGRVSAGLMLEGAPTADAPAQMWANILRRYPSIQAQLADARLADVPGQFIQAPRVQRRWARGAGKGWAALPSTIGFIDPLHSTGIAHTLSGVERLLHAFGTDGPSSETLHRYEQQVFAELRLIDQLVAGCYHARSHFGVFTSYVMAYFAAVTTYERARTQHASHAPFAQAFLCAENTDLSARIDQIYQRLVTKPPSPADFAHFVEDIIAPYNEVGLFHPAKPNMYEHTAAQL